MHPKLHDGLVVRTVDRTLPLGIALSVLLFVALRVIGWVDDIPNPDIAGITYEADVITDGGLPYVETVEFKAPGSFFVVAAIFGVLGRSIGALQVGYLLWGLLGGAAIVVAARRLYPEHPAAVVVAACGYFGYVGMFSFNYSSWMMPPYCAAFACGIVAVERTDAAGRRWAVAAGVLAMASLLFKRQGIVIFGVLVGIAWLARRRGAPGATRANAMAALGGVLGMFTLVAAPYVLRGELGALLSGLFPVGVGRSYVAATGSSWSLLGAIAVQWLGAFPVLWAAALAAVVAGRMESSTSAREGATAVGPVVLLIIGSAVGVAMGGFRSYLHYLVQLAPGLALAAAHPFASVTRGSKRQRVVVAALWAIAGVWQGAEIWRGRAHRETVRARHLDSGSTAGQAAGAHIRANTQADDTIFVWGWTGWRVYFWADRRAPGPVYKAMGTLTDFNGNTAFTTSPPLHFRPGPHADQLIDDLHARPPLFIVHSNSYIDTFGSTTDPIYEFEALVQIIRTEYRPDAKFGDLTVFRRRD